MSIALSLLLLIIVLHLVLPSVSLLCLSRQFCSAHAMTASDAASSEIEHISCRCLNVAATIRVRQREGRIIKGTLVDELQKVSQSGRPC